MDTTMKKVSQWLLIIALSLNSITAINAQEKGAVKKDQLNDQDIVSQKFEILHTLYRELEYFYTDSVSSEKALQKSIDGLMSAYDPYTVYMPEEQSEDFKVITTGEYGGVGALISNKDNKVIIQNLYENMPAQKAGLIPGDQILSINGIEMKGENIKKCSEFLRGEPGSSIKIEIKRLGKTKELEKTVKRELVTIDQVQYYGLISNDIGYMNLLGFTDKSAKEIHHAFISLKEKGMTKLILDLRNNGGGLLDQAVDIANFFVPKGQKIVSTKGKVKQWDQTYKTNKKTIDTKIPIVILVNSRSASASEILSGSMQDLDRAVILGTRTFGKGLVQTTRPLPYNGTLKVTTAKYYIPSGRCIQAIDYSHRNEDGSVGRIPDSLMNVFHTRAGRKVLDGGGIIPDVKLKANHGSTLAYHLIKDMLFFKYANKYYLEHKEIKPVSQFDITDTDYNDFIEFTKEEDFKFKKNSSIVLEKLKETLKDEGYAEKTKDFVSNIDSLLTKNKNLDFEINKKEIKQLLGKEIISRYYYEAGKIKYSLKYDPWISKAKEILNDQDKYNEILSVQTKK